MHIFHRPPEAAVRDLLSFCDLPTEDLERQNFENFFGCGFAGSLSGVVGIELLGEVALLRSLAVSKDARGNGLGKQLVAHAEAYALASGVKRLFLLTTSAERFFESLGFVLAERKETPLAVRSTKQFSSLCPSTAHIMVKHIAA